MVNLPIRSQICQQVYFIVPAIKPDDAQFRNRQWNSRGQQNKILKWEDFKMS